MLFDSSQMAEEGSIGLDPDLGKKLRQCEVDSSCGFEARYSKLSINYLIL